MTQPPLFDVTDWNLYRKCTQVCRAQIGEPCITLSGRIIDGRPDGIRHAMLVPHKSRKLRTRNHKNVLNESIDNSRYDPMSDSHVDHSTCVFGEPCKVLPNRSHPMSPGEYDQAHAEARNA